MHLDRRAYHPCSIAFAVALPGERLPVCALRNDWYQLHIHDIDGLSDCRTTPGTTRLVWRDVLDFPGSGFRFKSAYWANHHDQGQWQELDD